MMKKLLLLAFVCAALLSVAQDRVITCKVTAADDNQPIPGANILVKGTSVGTSSDANGDFTISVGNNAVLIISYIGYATQEVEVGGQTSLNIIMQTDITSLAEVVVVGYGEVQKKDATGAVVDISSKDFNKGVLTSPQDLLVGKFAGVSITTNSGAPGSGATIRIRGGASLSASNDPLIVIDGFPVDNTSPGGVSNPLAAINPNDIETFTVLKDASATAIYGSRASNGVIIITTKKGTKGKLQLNYNGSVAIASPMKYVDVMDATEYKALVNKLAADGTTPVKDSDLSLLGNADTNWQKEIFRTTVSQNHNLTASGSSKKISYRISYGYTDQQGILKTTDVKRHSLNINVSPTLLNDNLKMNFSVKGSYTMSNFGDESAVGNAVSFDPTQPVRDGNSTYGGYFSWLSLGKANANYNPVAQLEQTDNQGTANRVIANANIEYKLPFLSGLKVVLNTGTDLSSSDGHNRVPIASFLNSGGTLVQPGRDNTYSGSNHSELLDLYFNYAKEFGDHKIDFTVGYGWQHFYRTSKFKNVSTVSTSEPLPSPSENYLISFFGRLNYSFKGKYLVTATLRDDGSSRVSKENRWGLFPSAAVAWRLKDEAILSGVGFLSDLKLRAGYGITGQQDIPGQYYPYLATYKSSNNLAQYQLGNNFYTTVRPQAYDPNIKWEQTTTYNVGLDFGIFNDRLTGSVELFQKNTVDLLNTIGVANGATFSNFLSTNVGSMENQGIEVTLNGVVVSGPDFSWKAGVNFTSINSNITKLNLTDDPTYPGTFFGNVGVGANIQNNHVGFPANSFFPNQQVYDESGKPIEGLYVDRSGKGGPISGTNEDRYHFHRPNPKFLMGFNSRLNYKQFDFSFQSRLSIGNYVYNNVEAGRAYYNGVFPQGYFANVPKYITDANFTSQQIYSDYYVQNASFFKLDNMSLGYSLEKLPIEKLKARFSLTVTNAFFITKYKGLDPEVDGGIDNNIYPRPRTFLLGVNLTF